jgi:hypothetical protein
MDTTPSFQHHPDAPTRTTAELLASSAPPVRWVIPDYIGEGLTILAGRQNVGKSWLALDWAVAVASGGMAMGSVACEQGDVLYVDLENGERRIRSRLEALFPRKRPPRLSRLEWLNDVLPDKDIVRILDDWRLTAQEPRLVVIDASRRLQQPAGPGVDDLDGLWRWATGQGIAVVCLLRTRKPRAKDPHEAAANVMSACADAVLLLDRDSGEATLDVRGRDVADKQMALSFGEGRWSLQGDAVDLRLSAERMSILDVLRDHDGTMTPRAIADILDAPPQNVRRMLSRMVRDGEVTAAWRGSYLIAE